MDMSSDYPFIFTRLKDGLHSSNNRDKICAAGIISRMLLKNATAIPLQDVRVGSSQPFILR
jgi:hypothetical protein